MRRLLLRYLGPAAAAFVLAVAGFLSAGEGATSAPDLSGTSLTITTASIPATTEVTTASPTTESLPTTTTATTRPATTASPPPPPPPARTRSVATTTSASTTTRSSGKQPTRNHPLRTAVTPVWAPGFPGWIIAAFAAAGVLIVSGLAGFVYTHSRPR